MKWANYDLSGSSICAAGFDKCWLLRLRQPYIIHLISASEGNSEFCFRESQCFPRQRVMGNIQSRENKTRYSPREQTLISVLLYN